jgi:hypothetical protein
MLNTRSWLGLCAALPLALAPLAPARAAAVYSWAFDPETYLVGSSGSLELTATVTNTGTENIVDLVTFGWRTPAIAWVTRLEATVGGEASAWQAQFDGLDLAPGDTFRFVFLTVTWMDAPVGSFQPFADPAVFLAAGGKSACRPNAPTTSRS